MPSRLHRLISLVVAATAFSLPGCSSSPRLPADAKLIRSWEFNGAPSEQKDILPLKNGSIERAGTFYVVSESTGRIEGAQYVWSGSPNFHFTLVPGKRYSLYFVEDKAPSTRPAG